MRSAATGGRCFTWVIPVKNSKGDHQIISANQLEVNLQSESSLCSFSVDFITREALMHSCSAVCFVVVFFALDHVTYCVFIFSCDLYLRSEIGNDQNKDLVDYFQFCWAWRFVGWCNMWNFCLFPSTCWVSLATHLLCGLYHHLICSLPCMS